MTLARSTAWRALRVPVEPAFQVYREAPVAYEPDAKILVSVDAATNKALFVVVHASFQWSIHDASRVVRSSSC
jgi:hypothetical protein